MAAPKLKYSVGNSASTAYSSAVSTSDTTHPIASDTNFSAKTGEGTVLLDEGTVTEEIAYSTGKTGSSLTIPLANRGLEGGTAQAHSAGASVKGTLTALMWNDMIDTLKEAFSQTTGKFQQLKDANGNEILKHTATASAVNEFTMTNAATGNAPALSVTGDDTNIDLNLVTKGSGVLKVNGTPLTSSSNNPEGFVINGRIATSVSSNNLTVALKGIDGNDPSSSNPVYVRIGNTVRTITSALSVTKNAGTNWFNAGGSELATKEIDYFVYIGYNATDGVVIGFSRIPSARIYSDFSATTTNEKYAAISTITTAASSDEYVNIGRFNAVLSAGAGYTWSIPATSIIINRPIYETRLLTFVPTPSTNGTAFTNAPTIDLAQYKVFNDRIQIWINWTFNATSGGDSAVKMTTPFNLGSTIQPGFGLQTSNGIALTVLWNSGLATLQTLKYDATTIISNSASCSIGGVYRF